MLSRFVCIILQCHCSNLMQEPPRRRIKLANRRHRLIARWSQYESKSATCMFFWLVNANINSVVYQRCSLVHCNNDLLIVTSSRVKIQFLTIETVPVNLDRGNCLAKPIQDEQTLVVVCFAHSFRIVYRYEKRATAEQINTIGTMMY